MREIPLNEYLSASNVWSHRLLGFESFLQKRDKKLMEQTYEQSIWRERLEKHRDCPDVLRREVLHPGQKEIVVSFGDGIFAMPLAAFDTIRCEHYVRVLEAFSQAPQICELGCGYGANLIRLERKIPRRLYGGDYSKSAVELGTRLGLQVTHFDYYEPDCYRSIEKTSTVLTVHSVEQLPDATPLLQALRRIRDRIDCVVHFEPLYCPGRRSFLGLIRNRYAQLNDYNVNLVDCLQQAADIEIIHREDDIFGINPLNSTSALVWRFR
jgi:SAM-dependent methyltransferase